MVSGFFVSGGNCGCADGGGCADDRGGRESESGRGGDDGGRRCEGAQGRGRLFLRRLRFCPLIRGWRALCRAF